MQVARNLLKVFNLKLTVYPQNVNGEEDVGVESDKSCKGSVGISMELGSLGQADLPGRESGRRFEKVAPEGFSAYPRHYNETNTLSTPYLIHKQLI